MKIAVLMSTYNGHKYLDEQLKSIAEQTVVNDLTLYIRDDGSKDDTFDIIDKWKNKINIVLYKEKNAGPAMSFWQLLMKSEVKADYYAFCDQDDIWDKDKLELAISVLKGNTHFYACNCRIIDENGIIKEKFRLAEKPKTNIERLFVSGCTQGCSMVFTDAFRKYIVEENLQCIPMHDIVLMLHALKYGTIFWDQVPHFGYRVHSNNVIAKDNKSKLQRLRTIIWNWKNSSRNSMTMVALEMLKNKKNLNDEEQAYLKCVSNYKKSIRCKMSILYNKEINDMSKALLRSYRMRVILNLF